MRLATPADLAAVRAVVSAAYARYLDRMDRPAAPMLADYAAEEQARQRGLARLDLFTNEIMTENQAILSPAGGLAHGWL